MGGGRGDDAIHDKAAKLLARSFKADVRSLLNDRRVCQALDALQERQGRRNDSATIATAFKDEVLVWAIAAVKKPKPRADWEEFFAWSIGKSWKALRGFPERIRKMAKDIDTLYGCDYFGPEEASQCWSLPSNLRAYADWMESLTEKTPVPTNRARHWLPQWAAHLSRRVEALTGRLCDNAVAELLNAADRALNPRDPNSEDRFHPQTLLDLRSRQKRKAPKT